MIIFHPAAQQELMEAAAYYEEQLTDLGFECLTSFEDTLRRIEEEPLANFLSHPKLNMRRCVVHRFPYLIYYRVKQEFIEVYAIAHQARKPNYWLSRTKLN